MASLLKFFTQYLLDVDGALLRSLGGDRLNASHAQGRNLDQHLRGTQRVLAAWGQSTVLQRAGLCHSLYSTDAFEQTSVPLTQRGRVQKAIGEDSERLAFLFCAVERAPFFRSLLRADSLDPSATIPIQVREGFEDAGKSVTGTEAQNLMMLHLANAAEQSGSRDERPVLWLDQFQRLARLLEDKAPNAVPAAVKGLRAVGRYGERQALTSYMRAIRLSAHVEAAIPFMEEVAQLLPPVPDPHLWLAYFWSKRDDESRRRYHARLADDKLRSLGTTWDKRIKFDGWSAMARAASRKRIPEGGFEPLRRLETADKTEPEPVINSADALRCAAHVNGSGSRFEDYLLNIAETRNKVLSGFYPNLRMDSFWGTEEFQLASALGDAFPAIKAEIDALSSDIFHDEAEKIERTGNWQVVMLLEAGRWHEENLRGLPALSIILKTSGELRLAGGLAYLARLSPHTVVSPHTGPTNMRLRLHFAVKVPEGDCALRVDGKERRWVEGKSVIFNDFLEHEVWNRTAEDRVVLVIDMWHPDITLRERKMMEAIHWSAQQHGQSLFEYWKKNELARGELNAQRVAQVQGFDDLVL